MDSLNFCYWLQGYFEIREASGNDKEGLSQGQINLIEEHLRLVFNKVTPQPSRLVGRPMKQDSKLPDRDPRQPPELPSALEELTRRVEERSKQYGPDQGYYPQFPSTRILVNHE